MRRNGGVVRRVILVMAFVILLPSLSSAAGRGSHGMMRAGGVAGLRGDTSAGFVRPLGIRTFGHPGFAGGFPMPANRVTEVAVDGMRVSRIQASGPVSPPLIIERRGDTYERLAQPSQSVPGPLVIERRGDTFERVR